MAFKKFGKKDSKQENENKNRGTDSNALSEDELSNVSGGYVYLGATSNDYDNQDKYPVNDTNLPYTKKSLEYMSSGWGCPSDFQYHYHKKR